MLWLPSSKLVWLVRLLPSIGLCSRPGRPCAQILASSPGPSQVLPRSRGEKSWEGLGSKLCHGAEMVDSVSTNRVHITYWPNSPFPVCDVLLIPGLVPIFLHGCKTKSGRGLGTRLHKSYILFLQVKGEEDVWASDSSKSDHIEYLPHQILQGSQGWWNRSRFLGGCWGSKIHGGGWQWPVCLTAEVLQAGYGPG